MSKNNENTVPQEDTPSAASILGWRYEYRFLAPDRVDIDVHLTFRKPDDAPILVGASLFAAGNTTPSGVVDSPAGVYDVLLPIRNFRCIPWTPYTVLGGAQKRYLLNMKLTAVPQSEWDEPQVLAFLGGTVGFRPERWEGWEPHGKDWIPELENASETAMRARLMQMRETGLDSLHVPANQSDTLYQLCDELGIVVFQEYDLLGDRSSEESVRLHRHPCVAFWHPG